MQFITEIFSITNVIDVQALTDLVVEILLGYTGFPNTTLVILISLIII